MAVTDSHENLVTKIWLSVLGGLRVIGKGVEKGRLVSLYRLGC